MVNLHAAKNVLLGKLGPHFTLLDPTKEVGHQFQPVCGYYSLLRKPSLPVGLLPSLALLATQILTLIYRFYIPLKPSTYM